MTGPGTVSTFPVPALPQWTDALYGSDTPPKPPARETSTSTTETTTPRTWRPVDLTPVLDGTWKPPQPTVGSRDDGAGLFYPGRCHVVAAEAESGKSWLALAAAAGELTKGNACIYLDFEDDEGGIAGRLMTMGVSKEAISSQFAYIRPESPVFGVGLFDLAEAMHDLKPSLVAVDGVTEAMSLHSLELKDNTDVARFGQLIPRPLAAMGAAVVMLDHVIKDKEARGGHAIGGVHKLNGLNGAMYLLENRDPFGIGRTGKSSLKIKKDRPGQLRKNGVQAGEGLFWYADLVVRSHGEDFAEVSLPAATPQSSGPFRPTTIMAHICEALAATPAGLSGNAITGLVKGKATVIRGALELLVAEGFVEIEQQGSARVHRLVRGFQ